MGATLLFGVGAVATIAPFTTGAAGSTPQQVPSSRPAEEPATVAPAGAVPAKDVVRKPSAPSTFAPAPALSAPAAISDAASRATGEAKAQLEVHRAHIVARCWPAAGLARGATRAKLVLSVTFDATGREIARGISEDRRTPAAEFTSCLRQLETPLAVSAPGTVVALSIPLTYP